MKIIRPKKLKVGDLVTVVSPSQPIASRRNFNRGVKTLESLGLEVMLSRNVQAVFGMYEAGIAEQRAADLNEAFANDEVKAIFMSGGGFLANKVLPLLDYDLIRKNPKIIIGFSDGTTLLNAIFAKTGLITFHGFSIEHFFKRSTPYTINSFLRIVEEGGTDFQPWTNWRVLKEGRATGRLLGGNLLSFVNLLGTSYCPDLTNSILFLEEHDDYSEDIENSLTRLINAEVLGGDYVQGIIFGKLINITLGSSDPDTRKWRKPKGFTMHQLLKRLFEPYQIPILTNVDFGLINTPMTIPIGIEAVMDTTKHQNKPFLKLTKPAVR